jgi:hypothetical protein
VRFGGATVQKQAARADRLPLILDRARLEGAQATFVVVEFNPTSRCFNAGPSRD